MALVLNKGQRLFIMINPEKHILPITSPIKGVNTVVNREGQPPDTCWSALNMVPYDRFGRKRVAQRPGLVSPFSAFTGGGFIQNLTPVNFIYYPSQLVGVAGTPPAAWPNNSLISVTPVTTITPGSPVTISIYFPSTTTAFSVSIPVSLAAVLSGQSGSWTASTQIVAKVGLAQVAGFSVGLASSGSPGASVFDAAGSTLSGVSGSAGSTSSSVAAQAWLSFYKTGSSWYVKSWGQVAGGTTNAPTTNGPIGVSLNPFSLTFTSTFSASSGTNTGSAGLS